MVQVRILLCFVSRSCAVRDGSSAVQGRAWGIVAIRLLSQPSMEVSHPGGILDTILRSKQEMMQFTNYSSNARA